MGNCWTNFRRRMFPYRETSPRPSIGQLVDQVDSNHDGVITRAELQEFVRKQIGIEQQRTDEAIGQAIDKERQTQGEALVEAKKEAQQWKEAYDKLYAKHEGVLDLNRQGKKAPVSNVSNEAIADFVQCILDDPNTNLRFVPDSIEGAMYRQILGALMSSLDKAFSAIAVELMGHRIQMSMEPLPRSAPVEPNSSASGEKEDGGFLKKLMS